MAAAKGSSGGHQRHGGRGWELGGAIVRWVGVLAGVAVLAACSASGHSAAPATTAGVAAVDQACPLTRAEAVRVLGPRAAADRPPAASGIEQPTERCEYAADGASLQLTVFAGGTVLDQLKVMLSQATPAAELGPEAYCHAGPGSSLTAITCIFLKDADTYVLGLLVPNGRGGAGARQGVRAVADAISRTAVATTSTSS